MVLGVFRLFVLVFLWFAFALLWFGLTWLVLFFVGLFVVWCQCQGSIFLGSVLWSTKVI